MVTKHGETEFKGNIGQLEKKAPFLTKVSQSYLVNPINIKAIDPRSQTIIFNNDFSIKYSRAYKKVVNDEIIEKYDDINII